jgi:hypothetical protein
VPQSREDLRAERLRELDAQLARAKSAVAVVGLIVQGREARAWPAAEPLEVTFASSGDAGLSAGVWVALRRGDVDAALEALVAVSAEQFVVGEREELGSGYRLQTVEEAHPLPDVPQLQRQVAAMLDIPVDVVAVVADWGPDDPRTHAEIDALLDSRFGPAVAADNGAAAPRPGGALTMSVAELADVLQLTPAQGKVLATLVRRAGLSVSGE